MADFRELEMRVAIVSDQLFVYGGAERVVEQLLAIYPQADLFALVDFIPQEQRGFLQDRPVQTTLVQRLPGAARHFRKYFHLWPRAIEALDLDGYDLVISSHHSVAHGVLTGPDQLHLCYTHSPMRYAWDQRRLYAREAGVDRGLKGWWVERTMHKARLWDTAAGARPDAFAANSAFVGRRIEKFYRRPSTVVHPPVDVGLMPFKSIKQGAYLTAGRIVNYKRFDLVVEAFRQMPDRQLVVAGSGADLTALRKDPPANVRFTGWLPDVELRTLMADAPAFLFAGVEDFGIMPIEAQACGTPVIALNQGGLKETLVGLDQPGQPTAILFEEQSVAALIAAVETFERHRTDLDPHACVANAARFAPTRFRQAFRRFAASAEQGSADAAAKQPEPAAQVKETVRQSAPAL